MSFVLPDLTIIAVLAVAAAVVGVALVLGVGVDFLARNRKVRVARHESIATYWFGSVAAASH